MTSTIYCVSCIHNDKRLVLNVFRLSPWAESLEISDKDSGSPEESGGPWPWPGAVPLVSPCEPCREALRFSFEHFQGTYVLEICILYLVWWQFLLLKPEVTFPASAFRGRLPGSQESVPTWGPGGGAKAPERPSWQIFLSFSVSLHFCELNVVLCFPVVLCLSSSHYL